MDTGYNAKEEAGGGRGGKESRKRYRTPTERRNASSSYSNAKHRARHRNEEYEEETRDKSRRKTYAEMAPKPISVAYSDYSPLKEKLSPPWRPDDKEGHYVYVAGENLTRRYKILSHLGEGTFGKVIECWDRIRKQYVAIKVIRNVPKYRNAAILELAVLDTLKKNDLKGAKHCVQLIEWFDYRAHICMVFERLGLSLFDLLRRNSYRPFDLYHIQKFTKHLLEAVCFMHSIELIHTDLKPENILLPTRKYRKVEPESGSRRGTRIPEKSDIFLIDFGSAIFQPQHHSAIVSTRHYRAPEIILGLGWSFPCDIWSIGCILVELVTGEALFKTHDNLEHLAMMQQVLGKIPHRMSRNCSQSASEYFQDGELAWPNAFTSSTSKVAVFELDDISMLIEKACDISVIPALGELNNLLRGLLSFEPSSRLTASAALDHTFFTFQCKPSQ